MTKLILFVLALTTPAWASPFTAEDFPTSEFWIGTPNDRFPTWAAETADRAIEGLDRGATFDEVLREVADARAEFQRTFAEPTDKYRPERAGVARVDRDEQFRSLIGTQTEAFIDQVIARHPTLSHPHRTLREVANARRLAFFLEETLSLPIVNVCHTLLSSSVTIVASQLKLEDVGKNGLIILHPEYRRARQLLRDVHARVNELRERPEPANFTAAMQAYFHAVPYYRGSAAIGRIAFAALHLHIFGETRKFPADVDVRAMTMTPQDFRAD